MIRLLIILITVLFFSACEPENRSELPDPEEKEKRITDTVEGVIQPTWKTETDNTKTANDSNPGIGQ